MIVNKPRCGNLFTVTQPCDAISLPYVSLYFDHCRPCYYIRAKRDQSLSMKQPQGPPVLIPEGGLNFPPAIWQAFFWICAPIIAATAVAIPVLFITWAVCAIITFIWDQIEPPQNQSASHYLPETNPTDSNETT